MKRLLLLLALALPASAAESPTLPQILQAYAHLGWVEAQTERGAMVCLPKAREELLDGLVAYLAHRATTCVGA